MDSTILHRAAIALCATALCACGGGGGGGGSVSVTTGVFSLNVTDAAVDDAERVLVQFTGVEVKPRQGSAIEIPLEGESQTCQDLLDDIEPSPTPEGSAAIRCIDLLALEGTGSASLLRGEELEAGTYNWVRLFVDAERGVMDSIIVLEDGSEESLYVPSGGQSGLKLNSQFTILAGGRHDFIIDFDLRKSVNNPKGFPDYRLKPSLRLINMAESGNIVGTVDQSLLIADDCSGDTNDGDGFAVYIYEGADAVIDEEGSGNPPLTSASVRLNNGSALWEYNVGYLAPGDYSVAFTCQAADDDPEEPDNGITLIESSDSPTNVVADQDSTVDFP